MGKLSDAEKKRLLSNKFVEKITNSHVVFTVQFKILAVEKNLKGFSPSDIFNQANIPLNFFEDDLPKKSISRWKKVYLKDGPEGFSKEKRGRKASGRPKKAYDPNDYQSVLDRLAYLEMENDFLKKLHALASQKKKNSL